MIMTHPGLPLFWGLVIWGFMLLVVAWALLVKPPHKDRQKTISLSHIAFFRTIVQFLTLSRWPLVILKLIFVAIFLLIITAGLYGNPSPERNIATVLTWNIWWSGLVISVFFLGSSWCAICPWDTLASWLVKPKLWFIRFNNSLGLTPPAFLRSVWPALSLLIILTWLELGVGVTNSPYITALLSLVMIVLASIMLALFKNKAFCRYMCPVGRTIGFYSQLAPIALRPINSQLCSECDGLQCFNGNKTVGACPTQLVMGTMTQNTYCTSCGNCLQSCPQKNISWQLRLHSSEVIQNIRPHWDETWFMLGLLALTSFHGLTMMPFWETWMYHLAQILGHSEAPLYIFSVALIICLFAPVTLYSLAVYCTLLLVKRLSNAAHIRINNLYTGMVLVTLPLAFAYHIAHNLNHLVREGTGLLALFLNPLGIGTQPLTSMEKHQRHFDMLISQDILFALQGAIMLFGFWIAIKVLRYQTSYLFPKHIMSKTRWALLPMSLFIISINGFHLWLMMHPMIMRM